MTKLTEALERGEHPFIDGIKHPQQLEDYNTIKSAAKAYAELPDMIEGLRKDEYEDIYHDGLVVGRVIKFNMKEHNAALDLILTKLKERGA